MEKSIKNEENMYKKYFVQCTDEWNIVNFIGVFNDLKNAEAVIKESYNHLAGIEELELFEYASTFSSVFDQEVYDEDSGEYIRISGYIFASKCPEGLYLEAEDL